MSALLANLKSVALKFWWQRLLYQKSRDTCDLIAMTDSGNTAKGVIPPNGPEDSQDQRRVKHLRWLVESDELML